MKIDSQRVNQVFPAAANCFMAVALVAVLLSSPQSSSAQTALDTYVAAVDPSSGYSLASIIAIPGSGFTGYNIDLTSQTWGDPSEVTQSWKPLLDSTQNEWEHKMMIAQPDAAPGIPLSNTAILWIDGGSNPDSFDLGTLAAMGNFAQATNSVIVNLPTVPNQSLQFAGEALPRKEDSAIAKTFKQFLDGGDSEWPLLLPMVKSAVAAMDATQEYMQDEQGVTIDKFFIFGASKRGWTTWLTAAVEARPGGPDRVSGIAPGVIDFLNIDESMRHHRRVYETGPVQAPLLNGGFSLAVEEYVVEGVMDQFAPPPGVAISPRVQELLDIVDPYEYRGRLDLPKYMVNSTGDEFFVPDSSQFYFDDLIGPKYLRYMPNTSHSLNDDAIPAVLNFNAALELGLPLPEFSWDVSADGTTMTVDVTDNPANTLEGVKMWKAINPNNRDFRLFTVGAIWNDTDLVDQGGGQYVANVSMPATGATAFMVELSYLIGGAIPLTFTTEVSVAAVPEPASGVLLMFGVAATCLLRGGSHRRNTRS
ncbi:MAG: PhoPQ-activated pathogenicity [Planctomycetes bacterium]|nr:PhoPQ-activated pathogenicity [Planctomycetota bacterium]